jgi:hypothetical protein
MEVHPLRLAAPRGANPVPLKARLRCVGVPTLLLSRPAKAPPDLGVS